MPWTAKCQGKRWSEPSRSPWPRSSATHQVAQRGSGSIMGGERGCGGAERAAGKSRASDPIWRTTSSCARSEKAAASKCYSTSRCALSLRSPCLPPYVARRGLPPDTPSRSRCSNTRHDKPPAPAPTARGNSLRSCRRCSRQPPGASCGTAPARPSVFAPF